MKFVLDLLGMLRFQKRALRAQADRQSLILGLICFIAGFLVFGLVLNAVGPESRDLTGQPEVQGTFFSLNLIQAVLFLMLVYIPAIIVLSNAISGEGLGFVVSRQEYRAHASVLLPIWGLLFLIDALLQYWIPHFLVIGIFEISVGMLVLLPLILVYSFWAIKQLNYLSIARTVAVLLLSLFTLPVYYILTSFLAFLPFFIMIYLLYFGYQWLRGYLASQGGERAFRQHLHSLTQNPQDADAHYQLGLIHLKRGNVDAARRYFESALKIDPADPDYHYSLGRACESEGEWVKALEQYEETYRTNPEYGLGDIFREVGKGYLHTGSIEKGIEFLKYFLGKRGSDPEGRFWLAVGMQKTGNYDQARIQLNTILEQIRSNPRFFRRENREWIYRARALLRELRTAGLKP